MITEVIGVADHVGVLDEEVVGVVEVVVGVVDVVDVVDVVGMIKGGGFDSDGVVVCDDDVDGVTEGVIDGLDSGV